jgi:hypothetical protein
LARISTFSLVGGTLAALALSFNRASAATIMTHVDTPPMPKITPPSHTFKPAAVTGGNSGVVYRNGNGGTSETAAVHDRMSGIGRLRHLTRRSDSVAFGGKADIARPSRHR